MAAGNIGDGDGSAHPAQLATQSPQEQDRVTVADAAVPNDLAAEVIATQTELGLNPAGSAATVVIRLNQGHNAYGAHSFTVTSTADNLSVSANTDEIINVTAADKTITLPNAATNSGRMYIINNKNSSNAVVNLATGGGTLGGESTRKMNAVGDSITFLSNGTDYDIQCYVGVIW